MPNRIIRESILSSERVCQLDWPAEVFYRRLLSVVDDYGRSEFTLRFLRAKCYPLQVDRVREADIARWMTACQKAGLIALYQGVIGGRIKQFVSVMDFKQQTRSESKCPEPDATQMIAYDEQMKSFAHLGVSVVVSVSATASQSAKPPDDAQPVLEYPCKGKTTCWPLHAKKFEEYEKLYPEMDCMKECEKALQWLRDNPVRQKTATGMPKFLFGWLERAQNKGNSRKSASQQESERQPDWDWLQQQATIHGKTS